MRVHLKSSHFVYLAYLLLGLVSPLKAEFNVPAAQSNANQALSSSLKAASFRDINGQLAAYLETFDLQYVITNTEEGRRSLFYHSIIILSKEQKLLLPPIVEQLSKKYPHAHRYQMSVLHALQILTPNDIVRFTAKCIPEQIQLIGKEYKLNPDLVLVLVRNSKVRQLESWPSFWDNRTK